MTLARLGPVTLDAEGSSLILRHPRTSYRFDRDRGGLAEVRLGHRRWLVHDPRPLQAILDGKPVLGPVAWGWSTDSAARWLAVVVTTAASAGRTETEYRVNVETGYLSVLPRFTSEVSGRFQAFAWTLSEAESAAGAMDLEVPGPFWPHTLVRARTPIGELPTAEQGGHSAPDAGFGVHLVRWCESAAGVAILPGSAGPCPFRFRRAARGGKLTLNLRQEPAQHVSPGATVYGDPWHVAPFESDGYGAVRHFWRRELPLGDAPSWVPDAVILEVFPKYYGGFTGLTKRLAEYAGYGIDVLYLMPHWQGGYMPIDPFAVDAAYGNGADLSALVAEAHRCGMRVLFDMVIHGFSPESRWLTKEPEMFIRGEDGQLERHPTWKSVTPDWTHPAFHEFMAALARHDQATYGIDGYRVDAASYKAPNWTASATFPAYFSGCAAQSVMRTTLNALRETNPDAALLSEVFGPGFLNVCNFGHDNQTESPAGIQRMIAKGTYTARDYLRHMAGAMGCLPPGANRVFYTRNHDTSWFDRFDGYTDLFMAFEAVHALCEIPELYGGDPDKDAKPDDDPRTWRRLAALLKHRKGLRGATEYAETTEPNLFYAERSGRRILACLSGTGAQWRADRDMVLLDPFDERPSLPVKQGDPVELKFAEVRLQSL